MSKFRKESRIYSSIFKEEVVARVVKGEMSVLEARQHYEIGGKMTIYDWLEKLAPQWYERPRNKRIKKSLSMPKKEADSASELAAKIRSLKQLLDAERLRSEAFLTMIKLAEEKYNLAIEKKSGAKRSKR